MQVKEGKNILIILLIAFTITILIFVYQRNKSIKVINESKKMLLKDINNHYSKNVRVNKDTVLYDDSYKKIGRIYKDSIIELYKNKITTETEYFKVLNMDSDYYIKYDDVDPYIDKANVNNRYKKYIVFNENIVTNEITNFYNNGNLIYTINKSFSFPIVIKEENGYYVEYNNQLLFIKQEDVNKIIANNNTSLEHISGIQVLCYHSFYEENNQNNCISEICLSDKKIEEQAIYLHENEWFTPTMSELEMFIDGKIQFPKNSVVLTIDDGYLAQIGVNTFAKYELNATLFLITSVYSKENFIDSPYIEYHSHGDNLHNQGDCPQGQGGGIQCLDKSRLLADLKESREKLDNTTVFCYPFYEYNNYSIEVLKEAGFTMAFGGYREDGKTKIYIGSNKFKLPRDTIVGWYDLDYLKKIISS